MSQLHNKAALRRCAGQGAAGQEGVPAAVRFSVCQQTRHRSAAQEGRHAEPAARAFATAPQKGGTQPPVPAGHHAPNPGWASDDLDGADNP